MTGYNSKRHGRVVGSETDAFEKLQMSMRHAVEACTEIGVRRGDDRWAQLAITFETVGKTAESLFISSQAKLILPPR